MTMTATDPDTYAVVETGETVVLGHPENNPTRKPFPIVTVAGHRFVRFYRPKTHGKEPMFGVPCHGNCTEEFNGTAWALHVFGGVCFTCNGSGLSTSKVGVKAVVAFVKRREASARRAERARVQREAAATAARAAYVAEHADLIEALAPFAESPESDPFLHSLATSYRLSPAQVEVAWKALAEHAERQAQIATMRHHGRQGDKVAVTGVVAVATAVETAYGVAALRVVTGTGEFEGVTVKVFGSGKTLWEVERDDVVTVTGTVKDHEHYDGVPQTVLTRARFTK